MLTLQLQILNSLTKAASEYADLYADLMRAYQPNSGTGRSWYRPPAQDPFSAGWPFMMAPQSFALSPLYAFAMLGPMAWQNQASGPHAMFAAPLAMMNLWTNAWGLSPHQANQAQPFAPVWPWAAAGTSQASMTPGYGMIKMSITFPDDTEIKFAFPGPAI